MKLYKSNEHQSEDQINGLLASMTEFISNPQPGQAQPRLSQQLREVFNSGLDWEFVDKSEAEEKQEESESLQVIEDAKPKNIAIKRKNEIISELTLIDMKSIRAIREGDSARMQDLEDNASLLRLELSKI